MKRKPLPIKRRNKGNAFVTPTYSEDIRKIDKQPQIKDPINRKFFAKKRIQIILLYINAVTLLAFIGFSWLQSSLTRQALERADSANANTKQSNILAESSFTFTRRSTERIINLTEQQNLSYKESSDSIYSIAQKTMEAQIENSRTDLRPYLCFNSESTNFSSPIPAIGTYTVDIMIKNFGKTPAFDMTYSGGVFFRKDFKNELFPALSDSIVLGAPIIPPGVEYGIPISSRKNIIDNEILSMINKNEVFIFIFIKLNYNQHVGNKVIKHNTKFCIFYDNGIARINPYGGVDYSGFGFDSDQ